MLDFRAIMSGAPVDPADVDDVRSVWTVISDEKSLPVGFKAGATGFSAGMLLRQCKSDRADILAVYARAALIRLLQWQGLLEKWRNGSTLDEIVFQTAATFPLPKGLQQVDPDEFIRTLDRSSI